MATINGANGDPLASMVIDPLAHPITIGTNDDHNWRQWQSPLVINGSNKMAPFHGDGMVKTSNRSWWHQWWPMATVAPMAFMAPMTIPRRQWRSIGHIMAIMYQWRQWCHSHHCCHWHHFFKETRIKFRFYWQSMIKYELINAHAMTSGFDGVYCLDLGYHWVTIGLPLFDGCIVMF